MVFSGLKSGKLRLHPHITPGWSGQSEAAERLVLTGFSNLELEFLPTSPVEACIAFDSGIDEKFLDCRESQEKVAVLWEPREINENGFESLQQNIGDINLLLTHDEDLLEMFPAKADFLPIGGSYLTKTDRLRTKKRQLVSISASKKRWLPGHRLRHDVISKFQGFGLHLYGTAYRKYRSPATPHSKFMFSIVIENVWEERFFTEKLLHAMLFRTVPIYWGSPKLPKIFDEAGVIRFESLDELGVILTSLSKGLYEGMLPAVLANQKAALEYSSCELNIQRVVANRYSIERLAKVSAQTFFAKPEKLFAGRSRFAPQS